MSSLNNFRECKIRTQHLETDWKQTPKRFGTFHTDIVSFHDKKRYKFESAINIIQFMKCNDCKWSLEPWLIRKTRCSCRFEYYRVIYCGNSYVSDCTRLWNTDSRTWPENNLHHIEIVHRCHSDPHVWEVTRFRYEKRVGS